jgi:hypothetical protein
MVRPQSRLLVYTLVIVTLTGGCERAPRAREREATEAAAKAKARAAEAARRAAEPPPEEPPVELLRVTGSGLPCQVDDVFAAKCRRCHTLPTRHNAPFVFLTWDDQVIGRAVRSGFMPYRIDANPPVQPLTDDEKKIILEWVDAGAPRQDCDSNAPHQKKAAATQPQISPAQRTIAPVASATRKR